MYEDQQRTTPYGTTGRVFLHQFKHGQGSGRLVIFALIAGLLALAVGAASLTFFLSYRSTVTTQISQLQAAVRSAQESAQGNASGIDRLSGKVSTMGAGMAAVAQFNQVCSQDLTGPNGPAQFDFMCKLHPAGG